MSTVSDEWIPRHRLTVDEFHRMVEAGVLAAEARVELVEGQIVDMAPIGSRHAAVVDFLTRAFGKAVADHAIVAVQRPVHLGHRSQPQPDLALLRRRADFFRNAHPTAIDILLIVEVSDTTLRYDREIKLPLYARHSIPEVWLLDLQSQQLHSYRDSNGAAYATKTSIRSREVQLAALADVSIDLNGLADLVGTST